jgi:hypothetical protein
MSEHFKGHAVPMVRQSLSQRSHEYLTALKRRRKSQKLLENSRGETRQAMADLTLARSCPYMSMALVLSIRRLVATASTEADTTPLERVFLESRPGRVLAQTTHRMGEHGNGKNEPDAAVDA